jgi:hypothetical protein
MLLESRLAEISRPVGAGGLDKLPVEALSPADTANMGGQSGARMFRMGHFRGGVRDQADVMPQTDLWEARKPLAGLAATFHASCDE